MELSLPFAYHSGGLFGRGTIGAVAALTTLCCALLALGAGSVSAKAPRCTILGTDGVDELRGGPGPDVICGRGGADSLKGGKGRDILRGGSGADRLAGGPGNDILLGGVGRDTCEDVSGTVVKSCTRFRDRRISRPIDPDSCCSIPYDPDPPELLDLELGGPYVDAASQPASIGLRVAARDERKLSSVEVELSGPHGPWITPRIDGIEDFSIDREIGVQVPAETEDGVYRVTRVRIADKAGNVTTVDQATLEASGRITSFLVFHGPDLAPPELTALSMPAQIDTTAEPDDVELMVGATDDVSGVAKIVAIFHPPWGTAGEGENGWYGDGYALISGTRQDGEWRWHGQLPAGSSLGYWQLWSLRLTDLVGQTASYSTQALEERHLPTEFLNIGEPDTQAPVITSFEFNPTTLPDAEGKRTVRFQVGVSDDITGILGKVGDPSEVDVDIEPAFPWTEFKFSGTVGQLIIGSHLDGTWALQRTLGEDATPGSYRVNTVSARDRAGNLTVLDTSDLEERSWPTTFTYQP